MSDSSYGAGASGATSPVDGGSAKRPRSTAVLVSLSIALFLVGAGMTGLYLKTSHDANGDLAAQRELLAAQEKKITDLKGDLEMSQKCSLATRQFVAVLSLTLANEPTDIQITRLVQLTDNLRRACGLS